MTAALAQRQHVLASYGLLAAGAISLLFVVLRAPIEQRLTFFERLGDQRTTYAKSLDALDRGAALREQLEQRQADSDPSALLFQADTAALAGAELQNQLTALIASERGTLLSSAFREDTAPAPLTPIAVMVRMRCSVEALVRILHGLESRTPLVMVQSLVVQSLRRPGRSDTESDQLLDVEFEVVGFLDKPAAP